MLPLTVTQMPSKMLTTSLNYKRLQTSIDIGELFKTFPRRKHQRANKTTNRMLLERFAAFISGLFINKQHLNATLMMRNQITLILLRHKAR